jgi:diguanylate cyclase (GGDEF)-like protein/PAS domain S-box-containing protein
MHATACNADDIPSGKGTSRECASGAQRITQNNHRAAMWPWVYLTLLAVLALACVALLQRRRGLARRAAALPCAELLDSSYGWECWLGNDGRLRWVNPSVERITGYSPLECLAMQDLPMALVFAEDRPQVLRMLREALAGRSGDDHIFRVRRRDGHLAWITASWQTLAGSGGVRFSFHDVTRRKIVDDTLRRTDEQFRLLVEAVKDCAIVLLDANGQVTSWNPGAARIQGYQPFEILGRHVSVFHPVEDVEGGKLKSLLRAAEETGWCEDVGWRIRKDGSRFWADEVISVLRDENECVRGYAVVTRDTSEQKQAEEELRERNVRLEHLSRQLRLANSELQRLARTDPLTGLLNRRAWEDEAEREHRRAERSSLGYSVIAVDLDHFKLLNDTFGHQAGDECLRRVAQALAAGCRTSDRVGRLGGEEFAVLTPETSAIQAQELAERLREAVAGLGIANPQSSVAPIVTASFGVAVSSAATFEEALRAADKALYEAKRTGRNRVCSAEPILIQS